MYAHDVGVANFNGHHGCLKCTTIGEFSHTSNTNIFPRIDCPKRTDEDFRAKNYGNHHKVDSPLLQLNIDMINQFPIGDSLHLLHLGTMKRLLFGWRDGTYRNSCTKWPAITTIAISKFLSTKCKMPREIHRAVRGLDCLPHWKGTEYRTFLLYIGVIVLKDHLSYETYQHYLTLYCAVTICESRRYSHLLPLARMLLDDYIECFREIYGQQYMTSNVHNLTHLVDEVEIFGELKSFSAYAFKNKLGHIKRLIRNGRNPLPQVAKRIIEMTQLDIGLSSTEDASEEIVLTKPNDGQSIPSEFQQPGENGNEFYYRINLGDFSLTAQDKANEWFLTNDNEIVCLKNIISAGDKLALFGTTIANKLDFFEKPIKSSQLDIYSSNISADKNDSDGKLFDTSDIKCKLVRIDYNDSTAVFIPLLHTIK